MMFYYAFLTYALNTHEQSQICIHNNSINYKMDIHEYKVFCTFTVVMPASKWASVFRGAPAQWL